MRHMLAVLVRHWPLDQREQFEEVAARFEFGDGLPRAEAERQAEETIREEWALKHTKE